VELVREADEWGESYYFKLNGKRVFAKGANVIPIDVFLSEIEPKEEVALVEEMGRSNFNMVRVWGGGTYASEAFLNACDSLGIMVWHDLMFACSMYPGDSAFLENVKIELVQQLARILSHPSVVQINGNNEVEVAWKNWGFQDAYDLNEVAQHEIEDAYESLFNELVPELLSSYPGFPYTHTSPLSNWGQLIDFNSGSQHYWGLWHGNDDLSDASLKIGRFNSEYGFQSFPSLSLLQAYASSPLNDMSNPAFTYKQRSYVGNKKIIDKIVPLYGAVSGIEDLIYKSQLYQAHALETYILAHRRNAQRCGGTLYWQLNDVFPGPTWSSIDFSGDYKAAHYMVKKCYEDILVTWVRDSIFVSNLSNKKIELSVNFEWLDLSGKIKESGSRCYTIPPLHSISEELIPLKKSGVKSNRVLKLYHNSKVPEQKTNVYLRDNALSIITGNVTLENCLLLNDSEGILEIRVDEFSEKTWLKCKVEGVRLKENFIELLPGKFAIPFHYEAPPELKDFHIHRN
jgi:beta-mannosidase